MKAVSIVALMLVVVGASFAQEAPFTFQVIDTVDQSYAPGFKFKGSWDTLDPHSYDDTWANGYLYDMYDDGTHGDETAGDHVWTRLFYFVPDAGVNMWEWGVTDTAGNYRDYNFPDLIEDVSQPFQFTFPSDDAVLYGDVTFTWTFFGNRNEMMVFGGNSLSPIFVTK